MALVALLGWQEEQSATMSGFARNGRLWSLWTLWQLVHSSDPVAAYGSPEAEEPAMSRVFGSAAPGGALAARYEWFEVFIAVPVTSCAPVPLPDPWQLQQSAVIAWANQPDVGAPAVDIPQPRMAAVAAALWHSAHAPSWPPVTPVTSCNPIAPRQTPLIGTARRKASSRRTFTGNLGDLDGTSS
jgi:hypothetical protein